MTHDLWATLSRKMLEYLDSVSLQDLVDQQRLREWQESGQMRNGRATIPITPVAADSRAQEPVSA
jgi:Rrf2 family iron-sulfur cluster assembly transcriptional regulator